MTRVARATAISGERRRRDNSNLDRIHNLKLGLPAEFKGDADHEYRWINDDSDRVYSLTVEDDWNVCQRSGAEAAESDKVRRQVGTKKSGEPLYAYLVRKRRDWCEDDRRIKSEHGHLREQELLKRPETDSPQADAALYVAPSSSIKRRGAYAP